MQSIRGAITIEKNEVKYIEEASIKTFFRNISKKQSKYRRYSIYIYILHKGHR